MTLAMTNELRQQRIVKGIDDVNEIYPYVVALVHITFRYRFCTGSLISESWVLTAAHCTHNGGDKCLVRYGNLTTKATKATYTKVQAAFKAPNFRRIIEFPTSRRRIVEMPLTNDLALLKVLPLSLSSYGQISAVDFQSLVGHNVVYVGTGLTMKDSVIKNDPLEFMLMASKDERRPRQIGEAVIVKCPKDDPDEVKTNAALLCLRPKCSGRYQRAQRGDSGGPLLLRGKIVGVACTVKHVELYHEAMYTAISPYLDWIKNLTANQT